MHITLITVGKLKQGALQTLAQDYQKRLIGKCYIIECAHAASKELECQRIYKLLPSNQPLIVLDERGTSYSSQKFAHFLQRIEARHGPKITFLIGGANGLAPCVYERAQEVISFGCATWPHQLVRVMLLEQLYRAQQIIKGHPYHKS